MLQIVRLAALFLTHGDRSREFLGILQSALYIFVAVADDDAGSGGCGGSAVEAVGLIISGPIPLPTHKRIYTVNRSTFVNKKAREQFQLSDYKRLIDIYSSTAKTVDALMKLELPSGVEVEIKV